MNQKTSVSAAGKHGWLHVSGPRQVFVEDRRNYAWLVWFLFLVFLALLGYIVTHSEQIHQFLYA
jgi:hypothetical protein